MNALIELVREARPHLTPAGPTTEEWYDRLEERHGALQDMMQGLLRSNRKTAQEMAAALWPYWWARDHMAEGRRFLDQAAEVAGPNLAGALAGLGMIAFRQGDTEAAERAFLRRLTLVERDGSPRERATALSDLARIALRRGDFAAVRSYAERARSRGR